MSTEIEKIALGFDATGARMGAAEYARAAQSVTNESTRAAGSVDLLSKSIAGTFTRMALKYASITGLVLGLRKITDAAKEQERVQNDLSAALATTGDNIQANIQRFSDYASEIQRQTIYGDELLMQTMAYGKNLGIQTHQLEAATKAAVGLAAKYRVDLNTSMQLVGRASQGQTQMLTRYGIVLNETLSPQDKFNELLKIGSEAFSLAEAQTRTASGEIQQMQNAVGDYGEVLGDFVLPIQSAFVEMLADTVKYLQGATDGVSGLSTEMERLSGKIATFETIRDVVGVATYLPEKFASAYHGTEQQSKITEYLDNKISELEALRSKLAAEESDAMLTPSAHEKIYGTPRPERPVAGVQNAGLMEENARAAQKYLDAYNPILVLQREQVKLGQLLNENHIDEITYMKAMADAEENYEKTLKSKDAAVREMFETLELERSLVGKTNDERERAIEMLKLQKAAEEAYGEGSEQVIEVMNEYQEKLEELDSAREHAANSLHRYGQELTYDMENIAQYTSTKMTEVFRSMEGAFSDSIFMMIQNGASFEDAMRNLSQNIMASFARMISDMIARWIMFQLVTNMFSGIGGLGKLFGGGTATNEIPDIGMGTYAAKGMVVPDGISGYSNTIVDSPTMFAFAKGAGIMGEAGPEAIMPLRRTPDGRLGVSGEGTQVVNNITIENRSSQPVNAKVGETKFDGKQFVTNIILEDMGSNGPIARNMKAMNEGM
jgi:lambda family phage tail tape measure protein